MGGLTAVLGRVRRLWTAAIAPRLTRRVRVGLWVLFLAGLLVLAIKTLDIGALVAEIREADPRLIALGMGVHLFAYGVRGARFRALLDELGCDLSTVAMTAVVMIGQLGNVVIPARAGDVLRAYLLNSRWEVPYTAGTASLATERLFDLLALATVGGLSVGALFGTGLLTPAALNGSVLGGEPVQNSRTALQFAIGLGLATFVAMTTLVVSARQGYLDRSISMVRNRAGSGSRLTKAVDILDRFLVDLQVVTGDPVAIARVGGLSVAIWVLDTVTAILVFRAFVADAAVSVATFGLVCALAVAVGSLAKAVPISPGGIGLYEAAFALIVGTLLPVTWSVALGIAIVDHLVKTLVTAAGGLTAGALLNVPLVSVLRDSARGEQSGGVEE